MPIKTSPSHIPVVGDVLLRIQNEKETIRKDSLGGYKFIPEMHLKQPAFTYSACGSSTKIKKERKYLKKQVIQDMFIKKKLGKGFFPSIIWLMEV